VEPNQPLKKVEPNVLLYFLKSREVEQKIAICPFFKIGFAQLFLKVAF